MTYFNQNPEFSVILINCSLIFISYVFLYPRFVKDSFNKLFYFDILFSLLALLISGYLFFQTETEFKALLFTTNWIWFTLLTYFIIESSALILYKHKYNVDFVSHSLNKSKKTEKEHQVELVDLPNTLKYMRYVVSLHLVTYLFLIIWSLFGGEEFQLLWGIHIAATTSLFLVVKYPKDKFSFFIQFLYLILMPFVFISQFVKNLDICDSSISCLLFGFGPSILLYVALVLLILSKDYYFNRELSE